MSVSPTARMRIGELLVSRGIVTEEDIEATLVDQERSGEPLGQLLVTKRLVTPLELTRALAEHYGFDFVDLDAIVPEPSAVSALREPFCRRRHALPYAWDGTRLLVAMASPSDVFTLDDIRSLTGADIAPALAEESQLLRAVDRSFKSGSEAEAMLQLASEQLPDDVGVGPAVPAEVVADAPVVAFVDQVLARAITDRASDVHLEPGQQDMRVRFRIDGVLHDVMTVPRRLQAAVVSRVKVMADIDIAERRLPQDGRVSAVLMGRQVDLRIATLPTSNGEAIVLRILDHAQSVVTLDELGVDATTLARWRTAAAATNGCMIVTGPTGSGKSTTLYATLGELNEASRSLITVEDPVEFRMDGIKQIQVNRRAGLTFPAALRSILRADPDILLVGEIRDSETANLAIEAALTGHLVLSSLHTNDSASAAIRLIDMGVEPYLVASSVNAVMAQRLVRRLCNCKSVTPALPEEVGAVQWPGNTPRELARAVGCPSCSLTGFRGRFAVQEVLVVSEAIARLILARATAVEVERAAVAEGMVSMRDDGLARVASGDTTLDELLRVVD